jgi:hypothetical protein
MPPARSAIFIGVALLALALGVLAGRYQVFSRGAVQAVFLVGVVVAVILTVRRRRGPKP